MISGFFASISHHSLCLSWASTLILNEFEHWQPVAKIISQQPEQY
jgi:hypothetical protein